MSFGINAHSARTDFTGTRHWIKMETGSLDAQIFVQKKLTSTVLVVLFTEKNASPAQTDTWSLSIKPPAFPTLLIALSKSKINPI